MVSNHVYIQISRYFYIYIYIYVGEQRTFPDIAVDDQVYYLWSWIILLTFNEKVWDEENLKLPTQIAVSVSECKSYFVIMKQTDIFFLGKKCIYLYMYI